MEHATSFTLYTTTKSAPGRKVLALAFHLGLSPRVETIDVYAGEGRTSEFLRLNPFGKVPTLVHGDFVLWESNAILLYLADAFGEGRLSSSEPRGRAHLLRFMFWEASHFMPSFGPVLTEFVAACLQNGRDAADPERIAWQQAPFWGHCEYLDGLLRDQSYVAGDALSVADFAIAGMFTYAAVARFPFARLPALAGWYERVFELDAFRRTEHPLWAA